jgi:hypothetical protein
VFSEVGLAIGDVIGVACRGDEGEGIGERTELSALLERFDFPAGGAAVEEKGERTKPKKRFAFSLDASFPVLSENCRESRRFAAACGTGDSIFGGSRVIRINWRRRRRAQNGGMGSVAGAVLSSLRL